MILNLSKNLKNISKAKFISEIKPKQSKFLFCSKQTNSSSIQQNNIKNVDNNEIPQNKKQSFFQRHFGLQAYEGKQEDNRWRHALPPFLINMCIGGPYAWSVMASAITKQYGVVASSALDWTLSQVTFPFSLIFVFSGLTSACVGGLQIKHGLRVSLLTSSLIYTSGILVGAAGIYLHSLPLLYFGGGVLTGMGVGSSYTPPIQTLMEWFPDRKGLAGGLCITGFGFASMALTPTLQYLMGKFQKIPTYIGSESEVTVVKEGARTFAQIAGESKEVVLAKATDLAQMPGGVGETMREGFYLVGSGDTGAAAAYGCVGAAYIGILLLSAMKIRKAPQNYMPPSTKPIKEAVQNACESVKKAVVKTQNVSHTIVMKTPQFWSLWAFLVSIASGGFGVIALAKGMMVEQFSVLLPQIVTTSFATSFVLMLSGGNIAGRLLFTSLQDKYGSRFVFNVFSGLSVPMYMSIPYFISALVANPANTLPLYGFIGSTTVLISIFGGIYASIPAYEAEIFGPKYIGAIHGKMLLGSTASALFGPNFFVFMRSYEEKKAIHALIDKIDPQLFYQTFQVKVENCQALIDQKVITIKSLMEIAPTGTVDPSPFLYNSSMYAFAGLVGVAGIIHSALKPIDPKFYEENQEQQQQIISEQEQLVLEQQDKQQKQLIPDISILSQEIIQEYLSRDQNNNEDMSDSDEYKKMMEILNQEQIRSELVK